MNKKIISLITCIGIMCSFAGCNSSESDKDADNSSSVAGENSSISEEVDSTDSLTSTEADGEPLSHVIEPFDLRVDPAAIPAGTPFSFASGGKAIEYVKNISADFWNLDGREVIDAIGLNEQTYSDVFVSSNYAFATGWTPDSSIGLNVSRVIEREEYDVPAAPILGNDVYGNMELFYHFNIETKKPTKVEIKLVDFSYLDANDCPFSKEEYQAQFANLVAALKAQYGEVSDIYYCCDSTADFDMNEYFLSSSMDLKGNAEQWLVWRSDGMVVTLNTNGGESSFSRDYNWGTFITYWEPSEFEDFLNAPYMYDAESLQPLYTAEDCLNDIVVTENSWEFKPAWADIPLSISVADNNVVSVNNLPMCINKITDNKNMYLSFWQGTDDNYLDVLDINSYMQPVGETVYNLDTCKAEITYDSDYMVTNQTELKYSIVGGGAEYKNIMNAVKQSLFDFLLNNLNECEQTSEAKLKWYATSNLPEYDKEDLSISVTCTVDDYNFEISTNFIFVQAPQ